MSATLQKALGKRIAEIRRRHFGARGKAEFAKRLGVSVAEYERYEHGTVPPGDLMVRICDSTGEDLQWLLTGVSSRGAVVITGARTRHQTLLTRLAAALDANPALAAPVEAFLELLLSKEKAERERRRSLPTTDRRLFAPIFDADDAPDQLPAADQMAESAFGIQLASGAVVAERELMLTEPAMTEDEDMVRRRVRVVTLAGEADRRMDFLASPELLEIAPGAFGVRLASDDMQPLFNRGDIVLATAGGEARLGRPALCKLANQSACCRMWLGGDDDHIVLGRVADHTDERVLRGDVVWALEVLYRLAAA